MLRVYRYRLSPTPAQEKTLLWTLDRLRELYNACLQERRDAYALQHVSVSAYCQMKELIAVRVERPEYQGVHTHLLQDAITRLDRAFGAFFRRVKAGQTPGYPRFKGRGQYHSFTLKDLAHNNGAKIVSGGKRVRLSGIGNVKVRLHRPMQGRAKQATITLAGDGHWYICFVCDNVPAKPLPKTGCDVGIDLGLKEFLATSDGEFVANQRPMKTARLHVERAQRKVSRRKKGSHRRRKAVVLLRKHHAHVQAVRRDFHHKTALSLVRAYDMIAIEDLNVKGLAGGMLAKSFADVGLGDFTTILVNKAECAGREVVKVNPAGTSQRCSVCDTVVKKDISVRVHHCPACGFQEDRDVNAALNILRLGRDLRRGAARECTP